MSQTLPPENSFISAANEEEKVTSGDGEHEAFRPMIRVQNLHYRGNAGSVGRVFRRVCYGSIVVLLSENYRVGISLFKSDRIG